MNIQLMNARPKDTTKEKWTETWDNSAYVLQPLADVLKNKLAALDQVKEEDFAVSNHYALLAYREGRKAEIKALLDLLPEGVEK